MPNETQTSDDDDDIYLDASGEFSDQNNDKSNINDIDIITRRIEQMKRSQIAIQIQLHDLISQLHSQIISNQQGMEMYVDNKQCTTSWLKRVIVLEQKCIDLMKPTKFKQEWDQYLNELRDQLAIAERQMNATFVSTNRKHRTWMAVSAIVIWPILIYLLPRTIRICFVVFLRLISYAFKGRRRGQFGSITYSSMQ